MNIRKGSIVLISDRQHNLDAIGWVSDPEPEKGEKDLIQVVYLDWVKNNVSAEDNSERWHVKARRGWYNTKNSVRKLIDYEKFPTGEFIIDRHSVKTVISYEPFSSPIRKVKYCTVGKKIVRR